jgi:hypothetical protein
MVRPPFCHGVLRMDAVFLGEVEGGIPELFDNVEPVLVSARQQNGHD